LEKGTPHQFSGRLHLKQDFLKIFVLPRETYFNERWNTRREKFSLISNLLCAFNVFRASSLGILAREIVFTYGTPSQLRGAVPIPLPCTLPHPLA